MALGAAYLTEAIPVAAQALQARTVRVGLLSDGAEASVADVRATFVNRMRQLGFAEGRNLVLEARYASGVSERLPALAAELVARKPDVIVTISTPASQAAKRATSTIPIVFVGPVDPVGARLVSSMARPDGNATGLTTISADAGPKYVELLRELAPGAKRVAFLADTSNEGARAIFKSLQKDAGPRLALEFFDGRGAALERSLDAIVRGEFDGLVVGGTNTLLDRRAQVVRFAAGQRFPAIYARREYVDAGGLLFYGTDRTPIYARAAEYVQRILLGAKPGDLPVETPSTIRMVVNLKAAHAQGIKVPQRVLVRADEVIE